ncbi:MAG: sulfite exporter TauE/SafE family protein [Alphaproteobacteria bacterium]
MDLYFPIAEMSINVFLVLGLGMMGGLASGLFGVGGGFLMTPMLIFVGVPPTVAVATQANQLVAASVSGFLGHWRRDHVDIKMGGVLLVGGLVGSWGGVALFSWLKRLGHIDFVISLCYVVFLGSLALFMLMESARFMWRNPKKGTVSVKTRRDFHHHPWLLSLPFMMRFPKSKLYISALLPAMIGFFVGILVSLMGIGGGFLMVPAMIYLLGMPVHMVAGTSLFQMTFVTAMVTLLQAVQNQTVDMMLAMVLILGSVVGAQLGIKMAPRIKGEWLRFILAVIVLGVCGQMLAGLLLTPASLFAVVPVR